MAKLIAYGMLSTSSNAIAGNLVKACCEFCGKKFGSVKEAKQCEEKHITELLRKDFDKCLTLTDVYAAGR